MFSWFKTHFKLLKELEGQRRELDELKTEMKVLTYEWNDWFERFQRLHMKLSKREQRASNELATSEAAQAEGGGSATTPTTPLTARQRLINQQVAERRKRMGGE